MQRSLLLNFLLIALGPKNECSVSVIFANTLGDHQGPRNRRTNADGGEPNTAVSATKSGVSATRISDRRSPERDAAAILLAYRHGLRAAELTALCWLRLICVAVGCTSIGRKAAGRRCIRSVVQSYARCVGSYQRGAPTCSCDRARLASDDRLVPADGSAHRPSREACVRRAAAACLRIQARQRWPRHPIARALPGASQLAEHGAPHRASAGSVCAVSAGLGCATLVPSTGVGSGLMM
jgi:hypothetical protein